MAKRNSPPLKYTGVHERLRKQRGPASNHPCQRCGKPATQWAYDHNDPAELKGRRGPHTPYSPYSLNPEHYIPLCGPCHSRHDRPGISKLSDEQVAAIRLRYAAGGISQVALAREYGVSDVLISRVVRGKTRA